jgi:hypothetical protein
MESSLALVAAGMRTCCGKATSTKYRHKYGTALLPAQLLAHLHSMHTLRHKSLGVGKRHAAATAICLSGDVLPVQKRKARPFFWRERETTGPARKAIRRLA